MDLLGLIATYVRVVETGSLSAAARSLGVSVASVSRQIRTLEQATNGTLLLRSTRSMVVTQAGRTYYEHCLRILDELEVARVAVQSSDQVEGMICVTAPISLGMARVVPHLASFFAAHPRVEVDLKLEDRFVDLVAEGVDLAIRTGTNIPDRTSIIARHMFEYRRVLVASPAYLDHHPPPKRPEDLKRHVVIAHLGHDSSSRPIDLVKGTKVVSVEVKGALRTNAPIAMLETALAGLGVSLLPDWLVEPDLRAGRLVRVLPAYAGAAVSVSALTRTDSRRTRRVHALVDHLIAENAALRGR